MCLQTQADGLGSDRTPLRGSECPALRGGEGAGRRGEGIRGVLRLVNKSKDELPPQLDIARVGDVAGNHTESRAA